MCFSGDAEGSRNPLSQRPSFFRAEAEFTGCSFCKEMRAPTLGEGGWVCVQVGGGGWFACGKLGKEEKEEGIADGGGWGGDRQRSQQVNAHAFVKTTLQQTSHWLLPNS